MSLTLPQVKLTVKKSIPRSCTAADLGDHIDLQQQASSQGRFAISKDLLGDHNLDFGSAKSRLVKGGLRKDLIIHTGDTLPGYFSPAAGPSPVLEVQRPHMLTTRLYLHDPKQMNMPLLLLPGEGHAISPIRWRSHRDLPTVRPIAPLPSFRFETSVSRELR